MKYWDLATVKLYIHWITYMNTVKILLLGPVARKDYESNWILKSIDEVLNSYIHHILKLANLWVDSPSIWLKKNKIKVFFNM